MYTYSEQQLCFCKCGFTLFQLRISLWVPRRTVVGDVGEDTEKLTSV